MENSRRRSRRRKKRTFRNPVSCFKRQRFRFPRRRVFLIRGMERLSTWRGFCRLCRNWLPESIWWMLRGIFLWRANRFQKSGDRFFRWGILLMEKRICHSSRSFEKRAALLKTPNSCFRARWKISIKFRLPIFPKTNEIGFFNSKQNCRKHCRACSSFSRMVIFLRISWEETDRGNFSSSSRIIKKCVQQAALSEATPFLM